MARARTPEVTALLLLILAACGGDEIGEGAAMVEAKPTVDGSVRVGAPIRFAGGGELSQIEVDEMVAGERFEIRFGAHGLAGAQAEVGVMPERSFAQQEVAFGQPGQSADPRVLWQSVELVDGSNTMSFDLPGDWLARNAVVVAELREGGRRLKVGYGPRSEMVRGGRVPGGRALLSLNDVRTFPVAVEAHKITDGVTIDGRLDEDPWQTPAAVLRSSGDGEPQAGLPWDAPTRVWFAYDEAHLYLAARLPDVDVFSRFEEHDDRLWTEEALELFVHGTANDRDYVEYQVSPNNVTFDAHFHRYRKGDESFDSVWETAVSVEGTVNDDGDRDRAWTVEARIPWSEICARSDAPCPMRAGSELRLNIVRVERVRRKRVVALTLSPLHSSDFHAWQNAAILRLKR